MCSSDLPAAYGTPVTFTASVLPATAIGTVTFSDGVATVGSCTLSAGTCSLTTSALSAGLHSIVATYLGAGGFGTSASASLSQSILTIETATGLAVSPNPSILGRPVTLAATVTAVDGSTPTGTVALSDGTVGLGSCSLSAGTCSIATSALALGSHSLTARYQGAAAWLAGVSAPTSQLVTTVATATSLVSSPNPSVLDRPVTITASVAATDGTAAAGTVAFSDGTVGLGSCSLSTGTYSITTSALVLGSHTLTARYAGSGGFGTSVSSPVAHEVITIGTTILLATSPNRSFAGRPVTLTANVAASDGSTPVGTVALSDGMIGLGSCSLSTGTCSITTSGLSLGSHTLTARYAGSGGYLASVSDPVGQLVTLVTTTTSVSGPATSAYGTRVPFTVSVSTGDGSLATGSVAVSDGSIALGTCTLSAGRCDVTSGIIGVGDHAIVATYLGGGSFLGSVSAPFVHTVTPVATVTTLIGPGPTIYGRPVSYDISVTAPSTTPSGVVTLFDGTAGIGGCTLFLGACRIDFPTLPAGFHSLTAA